ncbi:sulfite exporter TauE/SafE family protein [Pararhizobium mangrovi]|uniref:Probable membrane transporter protein n=1 Tax=Pararhizobium mangrovi TaxID=2590452 RepID=A0A506U4W0_9HYPH|nr:sulfite exporter TauE/SafE family protein [Pararhizobium mangrovi]TPW27589.1 sulfite exporter TauE/SafE family protein [Pararhizobium mangrovi]
MPADPLFYLATIVAVILIGLSKGGLGGAMAVLGVPLMSLVTSPVQAAAILLPILIVMDWISLYTWWNHRDARTLAIMLPGGVLGVGIGWLTAAVVTENEIRLIVGTIALAFTLRYAWQRLHVRRSGLETVPHGHRPLLGASWGTVAGFTSFVAHAGGPPYQFYALPLDHDPKTYTGSSVRFFAIVNALKLIPYFMLGQFDTSNLEISIALIPVAILATIAGAWLVKRMRPSLFYPLMYAMVFVASLKLVSDGIRHLIVAWA